MKIRGNNNDNVITSGSGSNVLSGGGGNNTFVLTSGDDIITDYKPKHDAITLNEAVVIGSKIKGNDIILTTTEGNITLKNAKGKQITITDSTGITVTKKFQNEDNSVNTTGKGKVVKLGSLFSGTLDSSTYGEKAKKINASKVTNSIEIVGNNNDNSIKSGSGNDTINSGRGKNTLTGGKGADVFVMGSDSNNVITDYNEEDKIQLDSGNVLSSKVKGKNIIITTTEGNITIKGGNDKEVTLIDSKGKTHYYGTTKQITDENGKKFKATSSILKLDASERTDDIRLIGNTKDNTLISGAGDDTLSGGVGKDVFVYTGGNDLISDYSASKDKINLNIDDIKSYAFNGKNVILTTDKGTLTIKNGAGKKITFVDEEGNTTIQKYSKPKTKTTSKSFLENNGADYWFTEDNHFALNDDTHLKTIIQTNIDDRSLGKLETYNTSIQTLEQNKQSILIVHNKK